MHQAPLSPAGPHGSCDLKMVNYPKSGPEDFAGLLKPLPKNICAVAIRLRADVLKHLPDADEAVSGGSKMGMVLYSINGPTNVICGFQPTASTCKLFFHGWQKLKDAGYTLEGSGKYARHIKIPSIDELAKVQVGEMIRIVSKHLLQD